MEGGFGPALVWWITGGLFRRGVCGFPDVVVGITLVLTSLRRGQLSGWGIVSSGLEAPWQYYDV